MMNWHGMAWQWQADLLDLDLTGTRAGLVWSGIRLAHCDLTRGDHTPDTLGQAIWPRAPQPICICSASSLSCTSLDLLSASLISSIMPSARPISQCGIS